MLPGIEFKVCKWQPFFNRVYKNSLKMNIKQLIRCETNLVEKYENNQGKARIIKLDSCFSDTAENNEIFVVPSEIWARILGLDRRSTIWAIGIGSESYPI